MCDIANYYHQEMQDAKQKALFAGWDDELEILADEALEEYKKHKKKCRKCRRLEAK